MKKILHIGLADLYPMDMPTDRVIHVSTKDHATATEAFINAAQAATENDDIGCILVDWIVDPVAINGLCDVLERHSLPIVVNPILGETEISHDPECMPTYKRRLMLIATLVTPDEVAATALTGVDVTDSETYFHASEMLETMGPPWVFFSAWNAETQITRGILCGGEDPQYYQWTQPLSALSRCNTLLVAFELAQGLPVDKAVHQTVLSQGGLELPPPPSPQGQETATG